MRPVVRDLVTDPVDQDGVALRLELARASKHGHLRAHPAGGPFRVDGLNERPGEGVLAADEDADDLLLSHM